MSEERAPKLPPQIEALLSEMTPEDKDACLEFARELEAILKMIITGTGRQIAILQKQLQEAKTGSVATYNEAFNAGVDAAHEKVVLNFPDGLIPTLRSVVLSAKRV